MSTISVQRACTAAEASTLVGTAVPLPGASCTLLGSPDVGSEPLRVVDADTGDTVAIVTRLSRRDATRLRECVQTFEIAKVGRLSGAAGGKTDGRTFGWSPQRVLARREACRPTGAAVQHPAAHRVLVDFAGQFGRQFRELMPERAADDETTLLSILGDWMMEPDALWTSGVINRTAALPYHRDTANLRTWSAMPTLRYKVRGGLLHLPEYNMAFACGDGDVSWFCGKDLVHGVTPMTSPADGYRYSVVYYALQGMKNCRTVAEETRTAAARRTVRERLMADDLRVRLA